MYLGHAIKVNTAQFNLLIPVVLTQNIVKAFASVELTIYASVIYKYTAKYS